MKLDLPAFRWLLVGRFWLRLWDEVDRDDCWGMAAQLSYYFLLAFFPLLIFLSALISFLPVVPNVLERLLDDVFLLMPRRSHSFVRGIIDNLLYSRAEGTLTLALLSALWFASTAFNGMISLLNRAYQVQEHRSYLRTRSLAIGVTLIVSVFLVLSGVLLFFGDWLIGWAQRNVSAVLPYGLIRWVIVFFLLNVGIQIVYYALPAKRLPLKWLSPGSILATLGLIFGSLAFRAYVSHFGDYQRLWGGLSAVIALMLWFYLCSFCLVLGGEVDSEVHKLRREAGLPVEGDL